MAEPTTDCVYCHAPVVEVAKDQWRHHVPDEQSSVGYYTYITCDPLLFDDRRRRVATPTISATEGD